MLYAVPVQTNHEEYRVHNDSRACCYSLLYATNMHMLYMYASTQILHQVVHTGAELRIMTGLLPCEPPPL